MKTRQTQWMVAGGLLAATALLGALARGGAANTVKHTAGASTAFGPVTHDGVSLRGSLGRSAVLLGQDGLVRMELIMAANADTTRQARRPTDMVIVLDRSGSMSGEKMEQARAAVRELLAQLGTQDRFSLVAYSDEAVLAVPLAAVDATVRQRWLATLDDIGPSGGTNIAAGLDLGFRVIEGERSAQRVPHMLLISDGLANQGDVTHEGLVGRARRAASGEFMLSAVGVGADFNEHLMTAVADAGTGNYYYVQQAHDLAAVFARELDAARTTAASGVAVHIHPAEGVRVVDAAGYPLESGPGGVLFRPGSLFAGQERRVWLTLAVPHDKLGTYPLGRVTLAYGHGAKRSTLELETLPHIACVGGEDEFYRRVDVGNWGRSMVVDAYNKMQHEVARAVQEGRRDAALAKVKAFKDEAAAMNQRLQSPPVAAQLESADRLEAQVADAFEGRDQSVRRNHLSKSAGAQAVDARRAGSKK